MELGLNCSLERKQMFAQVNLAARTFPCALILPHFSLPAGWKEKLSAKNILFYLTLVIVFLIRSIIFDYLETIFFNYRYVLALNSEITIN